MKRGKGKKRKKGTKEEKGNKMRGIRVKNRCKKFAKRGKITN